MMISQTVEYSLRAVTVLASQEGQAMTVREMAEIAKVPGPYLSKMMKDLVRTGIVQSRRGLGGGFKLAKSPAEITIWDIVQAIDPIERIGSCPLGIEGHSKLCSLHRRIDQSIAHVEKAFRASTLEEIIKDAGGSKPLCRDKPDPVVQLKAPKGKPKGKKKTAKG